MNKPKVKQKPYKVIARKPLNNKSDEPKLNLIYALVLLGYAFITVLTPNLNTLDSNGPKFYTLAILNLVAYLIILIGNRIKPQHDFHWSFFRTWIGAVYTMFLLVSLISFFKAFNIYESIINFSKLFTIFSAAYIISIILRKDKRYLYVISISLAFLLIFDSLTVFYDISVNRMQSYEIKSIYSNKNILAASLFVKISFVLWLISFYKGWIKSLGIFSVLISFVAILFMSTRTFFIGSIFLVFTYGLFMIIRYYRNNEKRRIIFGTIYILATVIVIFLSYSLALKYIYKKSAQSGFTVFIERLKTLSNEKDGVRANAWQNSLKMINAHPFFGIGTGNWKIEVLKYETPATGAYIYAYKNHNDFIETTVDIGIFGGLLFLGIFLFIFANFLRAFFKAKKGEEESYKWLFLPAFGLFCYAFDALFNFPSDRPEIVSFFAIFVGAGIAFSPPSLFVTRHASRVTSSVTRHVSRIYVTRHALRVTLITVFLSLMVGSIYIFYLNFKSLKLQRIAKQELNAGNLTSSSDLFLREFPAIPDINIEGEPISVTIARYLINEGKYQQAIDLLKKDKSSPYDTRQEFFTAMAFLKMGQPDSALVYTHFVYDRKPYFSGNISLMASAYEAKGNFIEAMKVIDEHTQFNNKNGQPVSEIISRQKVNLIPMVKIQPFQVLYNNGMAAFDRKEYSNAVKYFTKFIEQEPGVAKAFEYRAFSYFYLEKYQSSYADINQTIILDLPIKASYLNLRGVILHMLGNDPPACDDFQRAINMGDKDAVNNYEKFCKKK